jgi:YVTN family beta-propeller protein
MKHSFLLLITLAVYSIDCQGQVMPGMSMNDNHNNVYLTMMDSMMMAMDKTPEAATVGEYFLLRMIPHHEGALAMANYEITHGKNFKMRQIAKNIATEQQNEIQLMRIWLKPSMTDTKITASYQKEIDGTMTTMMSALPNDQSLDNSDRSFALVMIPHHQAGIDMAKVLLKYENEKPLRSYAMQLISYQMADIEQMKDLGSDSSAYAQNRYSNDRVYTANQVSNTVSVVDPSTNKLLGEIRFGNPYPNVLSPLYRGESLVHGMGYSPLDKMLAVVSIGSNSVTIISTETNKVLKKIYVGRSPHEATFTPNGRQIWVIVRGEAYVSVIDAISLKEIQRIPVADGPGMVAFTVDGKLAYVCSSFTPEVDIVDAHTYKTLKKIPVLSPFSPNILSSPDGKWIAMTHKDVGKVTIINTTTQSVSKVITTGPITNHVTFCYVKQKLLMLATIGGENKVRVFDVNADFKQIDTILVGALPHGLWPSKDGKLMYVGLEYADQVQGINLETMKLLPPVQIGQSPQALVYATNAVTAAHKISGLTALSDTVATEIFTLSNDIPMKGIGRLAVRSIGLIDLIEQIFNDLQPNHAYTLVLSCSEKPPYQPDYQINAFTTNEAGKYMGQSTGLIKQTSATDMNPFRHIILLDNATSEVQLISQ